MGNQSHSLQHWKNHEEEDSENDDGTAQVVLQCYLPEEDSPHNAKAADLLGGRDLPTAVEDSHVLAEASRSRRERGEGEGEHQAGSLAWR